MALATAQAHAADVYKIGVAAGLTGYAAAVDRAFLGGIALGLAQALAVFTLGSGLKNVAALSVLLVFLFFRPSGILGVAK